MKTKVDSEQPPVMDIVRQSVNKSVLSGFTIFVLLTAAVYGAVQWEISNTKADVTDLNKKVDAHLSNTVAHRTEEELRISEKEETEWRENMHDDMLEIKELMKDMKDMKQKEVRRGIH